MARTPTAIFVTLAAAGGYFGAGAQRIHNADILEPSSKTGLTRSAGQLLVDFAVVFVVPGASVYRSVRREGTHIGTSATWEITKELGRILVVPMLLISVWMLRRYPHKKHEAAPSPLPAHPTKRVCVVTSPATPLPSPLAPLRNLWQFSRKHFQRRRLYLHRVADRLERMIPAICGSPQPLGARLPRPSAPGSHGIHDWHEALPARFLMPVEVAACRSPPDVSSHVQRLLADRWWELESESLPLQFVPESESMEFAWPEPFESLEE